MGQLMPKFTIEKMIPADRQRVFDVVANYGNFDNLLPKYFPSIRVRSIRENVAIVEEHLVLGKKELVMTTKHITKYPESHEMFVLGGDAKGTHIAESYEKTDSGTKLTILADIKLRRVPILNKSKIEDDYSKIIDELCGLV